MSRCFAIFFMFLFLAGSADGKIAIMGKEAMIAKSDLIAIVEIQELVSTDKSRIQVDLIATAHVASVLKGEVADKQVTFRIPRFFPCGAFDVSTGRHLVFLKKNEGEYAGENWYMSFIHLTGKGAKWYDESGKIVTVEDASQVIDKTKALIEVSGKKDE